MVYINKMKNLKPSSGKLNRAIHIRILMNDDDLS